MAYDRIYNFSAGPSILPEKVLEDIRDNLMNYQGSGMCVMEMSHRSKVFDTIIKEAEQDLRDLMNIPDNYKVMFIQGGATLQFAMIPMNLMKNGVADYIVTGNWSKKAYAEAKKYGKINLVATSEDRNYSYIPDCSDLPISEDADYVYICENETIHGTTFQKLPNTKGKILVSDQSSMFLSKPCNVSDYGLIYGGVQKNVGPAGLAIVIIREDLIREDIDPKVPIYLRYDTHANNGSMYNTPNCWAIYVCGKVFRWIRDMGGLTVMKERNEKKAQLFYDYLDNFGITGTTGIDFPAEGTALLQDEESAGPVGVATIGFGQGVAVTPIQLITAISSLGNEGKLMKPRLVKGIKEKGSSKIQKFEPEVVRKTVSKETADESPSS